MSKSYYQVESRIRSKVGLYPNRSDCLVGLFKTEELAEKWIQKHASEAEFYGDSKSRRYFFAVLECPVSNASESSEGAYLRSFWSKEGKKIQ